MTTPSRWETNETGLATPSNGTDSGPLPSVVTTLVAGAISLCLHVSFLISQLLGTAYHPVDVRLRFLITLVVASASGYLWPRRRTASDILCGLVFVLIVAPFWVTFWITEVSHTMSGRFEQPFVGPKLMLFVVSALCPTRPRILAPLLIAAVSIEVAGLWVHLKFASVPSVVATGEPWISISYVLLACFLFGSRLHWMRLHEELTVARAEATVLQTTNDAFVAVQDLANTPLQSLEIALALMDRERPRDRLVGRAQRAVQRLRALTRHLPVEHLTDSRVDRHALDDIRALRDSSLHERGPEGEEIPVSSGGHPTRWARVSHALFDHARHLLFGGRNAASRRGRHV